MFAKAGDASAAGALIERVINIAFVLALVFVGVGLWRRPATEVRPSPPPTYKVGETLPVIPGFDYAQGRGTLVLFVHSQCHFCTETMPVYREVKETLRQRRTDVRLVAVAYQSTSELSEYVNTQNLTPDYVSEVGRSVWQKLAGTPTLFLVDSRGVVQQIWRGKQEPSVVTTIVTAVARLTS